MRSSTLAVRFSAWLTQIIVWVISGTGNPVCVIIPFTLEAYFSSLGTATFILLSQKYFTGSKERHSRPFLSFKTFIEYLTWNRKQTLQCTFTHTNHDSKEWCEKCVRHKGWSVLHCSGIATQQVMSRILLAVSHYFFLSLFYSPTNAATLQIKLIGPRCSAPLCKGGKMREKMLTYA